MAAVLDSTAGKTLDGQPYSLLGALSASPDRRRQQESVRAYWGLVRAVALYRLAQDHQAELQTAQVVSESLPSVRAATAASAAMVQEAELAAVAAQHGLAAAVGLPPDAPLPLPVDRPHTGSYRTLLSELYPTGTAPAPVRQLDQLLPLRRKVIEDRALAVRAAEDAWTGCQRSSPQSPADAAELLACARGCWEQRRALVDAICQYNDEIAQYALAVAQPDASPQTIVAMLIKTPESMPTFVSEAAVRAASHNEPTPALRPGKNEPTPAIRPQKTEPTPAKRPPPSSSTSPGTGNEIAAPGWVPSSTAVPLNPLPPSAPEALPQAPLDESANPLPSPPG